MAVELRTRNPTGSNFGFANQLVLFLSAPLVTETASGSLPIRPLAVQAEIEAIAKALRFNTDAIQIVVTTEIATSESLSRISAASTPPVVLHYIGHGIQQQDGVALAVEDEVGRTRLLDRGALRALFPPAGVAPCQLAVLNACYTEPLAETFLQAGVGHVICIESGEEVLDIAAREFSRELYPSLQSGRTVADAFERARTSLLANEEFASAFAVASSSKRIDETIKFQLLPRGSSIHLQRLDWNDVRGGPLLPEWLRTNIPAISADPFVGRQLDLHRGAAHLRSEPRCLFLQGLGGMGKTALALAIGRWHHERSRFADGVWFVDLRNVERRDQVDQRLQTIFTEIRRNQSNLNQLNSLFIFDDVDALQRSDETALIDTINNLLGHPGVRVIATARHDLPGQIVYLRQAVNSIDKAFAQEAFQQYGPPAHDWRIVDTEEFQRDWATLIDTLDGYPFPIRLAATYMKQTRCSLHELVRRMNENISKTLSYPGSKPGRDASLTSALDLSFGVLPPDAKQIFPILSLFPSGFTDESAEAILGHNGVDSLETLLQYSMAEERPGGDKRRLGLPEPARRYADRHLLEGVPGKYWALGLNYYYEFTERLREFLADSSDNPAHAGRIGRDRFVAEQLSIIRVVAWGLESERVTDGVCRSARITANIARFLAFGTAERYAETFGLLEKAASAAISHGDRLGAASVLMGTGDIQRAIEKFDEATVSYDKAFESYSSLGANLGAGDARRAAAEILIRRQPDIAVDLFQQAVSKYEGGAHWSRAALTHREIGELQLARRNIDAAVAAYERAGRAFTSAGRVSDAALTEKMIAEIEWARGNYDNAMSRYASAVRIMTNR